MSTFWKRTLAELCVLAMLVAAVPAVALAEEEEAAEPVAEVVETVPAEEAAPAPEAEPVAEEPAAEEAVAEEAAPVEEAAPAEEAPAAEPEVPAAEEPAAEETPAEEPVAEEIAAPAEEAAPAAETPAEEPVAEEAEKAPFILEDAYNYYMSLATQAEKDEYLLSLDEADRALLVSYIAQKEAEAAVAVAAEAEEEDEDLVEIDDYDTPLGLAGMDGMDAEPAPENVTIWLESVDGGEIGIGSEVCFHAEVDGEAPADISYQWQVSADNSSWTDVAGANADTYTFAVSEENADCFWRVQVNF